MDHINLIFFILSADVFIIFTAIAWRPIRLACGHVFCVRCLIKAHRKRMYNCPICRQEDAVGNADANNLDQTLQNFMLLYFPKEIKEKRKENQREQASLNKQVISTARHHHTLASRRMDYTVGRTTPNSHISCNIM